MPAKKFTPAIGEAICKLIRHGIPVGVAAQSEGIGRATLYDWREKGRAAGEGVLFEFHEAIERALGTAEVAITMNVITAAADDWKAGAFWLKCRNRELYGDEVTVKHLQQGMQDMLEDVRPHMSASAYAELLNALAQAMGIEQLAAGTAAGLEGAADPERH